MPQALERLLTKLQHQPPDRSLDGIAGEVDRRLAETDAANAETWRLRAVAVLLVAMGGATVSASSAAIAAPKSASPFVAWSNLAPSTLLESAE
jgi:hypothetical protein